MQVLPFGAFGGDFSGSLGIPLRVRSIAQAASGSHPSSLVCGVRAISYIRLHINLLAAMRREGSAKPKANPKGLLNTASRPTPGLEGEVVGLKYCTGYGLKFVHSRGTL